MRRWSRIFLGNIAAALLVSCATAALSSSGAQVVTSQSPPVDSGWDPQSCKPLGYVLGRGGGSFGGAYLSNEHLIEYALNDLRNKAAALGANFVQQDPPQMAAEALRPDGEVATNVTGQSTSTASVGGLAYKCERQTVTRAAGAEPIKTARACVPGSSQACVGPGGCKGGQACADDGTKFLPCDCGSQVAGAAPVSSGAPVQGSAH